MSDCPTRLCFVPETGCALGHLDLADCPAWAGKAEVAAGAEAVDEDGLMPWSGSALGLADLSFLAGCGRPTVVGVVGPQGAGKTTLLAAWYLLLGRGALARPDRSFAGSFTLSGWEGIAGSLRWVPGQAPTFPPHTTSRGGRSPGLLHLAFRGVGAERRRDVLFTDAPGEWFRDWAVDRASPGAAGARWVAEHADVILFVADREALAGEGMGVARSAIQLLARRVAAERGGRPVALVWTKSDLDVPPQVEEAVRRAVLDLIPEAVEFQATVVTAGGRAGAAERDFVDLLEWALSRRRGRTAIPEPAASSADPLFKVGART